MATQVRLRLCAVFALVTTAAGCTGSPPRDEPTAPKSSSHATRAASSTPGVRATAAPTVIVLDASSSMLRTDAPGPRIAAARTAVTTLLRALPVTAPVGVVVFGTSVGDDDSLQQAGCRDIRTLVPLGDARRPEVAGRVATVTARGWTPLAGALQSAAGLLPSTGEQNIIVLTDGADTCTPGAPCPAAQALHTKRPQLSIDTVAFKADAAAESALTCMAAATGGVAVDADNTAQLTARIGATADPGRVRTSLTTRGYRGLAIGMSADAAGRLPGFPQVERDGTVRVVYVDCMLTFIDGVLTEIAPRGRVATLDGLRAGDEVTDAVALYGSGTARPGGGVSSVVLAADASRGTGYRIDYRPSGAATQLAGTITTIVLCRCRPVVAVDGRGDWHSSDLLVTPTSLGAARLDMTLAQLHTATGVSRFEINPDYADKPVGTTGLAIGPPVDGGPSKDTCFGAYEARGGPRVHTANGVTYGDTRDEVERRYGTAATATTAAGSQGSTVSGYVVRGVGGTLFIQVSDDNDRVESFSVLGNTSYGVHYCL